MIDNVYELKQRFVGFNKVKLLTVVFYCMAYSWCSFLNEYNAMENQEEEKKEEGIWAVDEDAVVYKCDNFTITYKWDEAFWKFIDNSTQNNNVFPACYEAASNLVGFLYRYQGFLGFEVKGEMEYRGVDSKELPGCCTSCCKGKLEIERLYLRGKKNELAERIRSIDLIKGDHTNETLKRWVGSFNESFVKDPLKVKKMNLLAVIANLFDQDVAEVYGQSHLFLSGKVKELIHENSAYSKVSFDDYMSLQGVIEVKNEVAGA